MAAFISSSGSAVLTSTSCTVRPARATRLYPPSTASLLIHSSRSCAAALSSSSGWVRRGPQVEQQTVADDHRRC